MKGLTATTQEQAEEALAETFLAGRRATITAKARKYSTEETSRTTEASAARSTLTDQAAKAVTVVLMETEENPASADHLTQTALTVKAASAVLTEIKEKVENAAPSTQTDAKVVKDVLSGIEKKTAIAAPSAAKGPREEKAVKNVPSEIEEKAENAVLLILISQKDAATTEVAITPIEEMIAAAGREVSAAPLALTGQREEKAAKDAPSAATGHDVKKETENLLARIEARDAAPVQYVKTGKENHIVQVEEKNEARDVHMTQTSAITAEVLTPATATADIAEKTSRLSERSVALVATGALKVKALASAAAPVTAAKHRKHPTTT
jgi:hypothetical protein